MEAWKKVFHDGLVPHLDMYDLGWLKQLLQENSVKLIQGTTVLPSGAWGKEKAERSCLLGCIGMLRGIQTVDEIEEFFASMCFSIDDTMGEPAACRWLLNFYDDTPRREMIDALLPEVDIALKKKEQEAKRKIAV